MRIVDFQAILATLAQPIVVDQPELAMEWLVTSNLIYPIPTIFVVQIGEEILSKPLRVEAAWEYLDSGKAIAIKFEGKLCSGFVILHRN